MTDGPAAPGRVALDEVEAVALRLAHDIRAAVAGHLGRPGARARVGRAPGGDATMAIDEVAEQVVVERLARAGDLGWYTEDRGLETTGSPRAYLVVDPIDGTRPAAAGFEAACVSIAVVPPTADARLGEVRFAVVLELKTGDCFTARRGDGARAETPGGAALPLVPSANTDLRCLFFTAGLRGRPAVPLMRVLEDLVDGVSLGGGYFDLGSAAFALTRVASGQLDAYVDVGRRVAQEVPATEAAFRRVGEGAIVTNFPYDVAGGILVAREAGAVVTHADGRALDDHPAIGAGDAEGLAVLAAGNADLHRRLRGALDAGIARLAGGTAPAEREAGT